MAVRFYYCCIALRCRRSFNVRIGLDEVSSAPVGGPTQTSLRSSSCYVPPTGRCVVSPKLAYMYFVGVLRRARADTGCNAGDSGNSLAVA